MFRKHVAHQLSAFQHGELSKEASRRVAEHLRTCARCQKEHEEIKLGISLAQHLARLPAPHSLWAEIDVALKAAERREEIRGLSAQPVRPKSSSGRPGLLPLLASVAIAILFIGGVFWWQQARRTALPVQANLDGYLQRVENSGPGKSYAAILSTPSQFAAADRLVALRAAKVDQVAGVAPLPGYELLAYRIQKTAGLNVVQLVYGQGQDAFSVFVAPQAVTFLFGKRNITDTHIQGIVCRQVDCPRTSTIWFGAGGFHCVLVSKLTDTNNVAAIIRYFITAHNSAY